MKMWRSRGARALAAAISATLAGHVLGATAASWLNPVDASWTDPSAWSINPAYPNNGSPDPADLYDVTIDATGAPFVVTLNSDISISSLVLNSADAQLVQSAGTFQLVDGGGTIAAGDYVLSNGTLASDDAITLGSAMQWFDGTLAGFGSLEITPAGSLNLGAGGTNRTLSKQINNAGVINFTDGRLILANGTINNQAGGVLNLSGASSLSPVGFSSAVRNSGLINVTGNQAFGSSLVNSGTINVAAGSTLTFSGGPRSELTGATITGPGYVELGTQNIDGTLTLAGSNINFSFGTISGVGNIDVTGNLKWNGGTFAGGISGGTEFNAGSSLNVLPGAIMSVPGGSRMLERTLNNSGTFNLNSASLSLFAALNNLPGGVINVTGVSTLTVPSSILGSFNNSGQVNCTGLGGSLTVPLINSGTLNVGTNCIIDSSGTYLDGSKFIGAGSINIRGTLGGTVDSTVTTLSVGSISGTGTLNVNAGTAYVSGTVTPFSSTGAINVAAAGNLSVGNGSFSTTVNNHGNVFIGPFSTGWLNNGTVNNFSDGVINGVPRLNGGSLNMVRNFGTIAVNSDSKSVSYVFDAPLDNYGTISVATAGSSNNGTVVFAGGSFTHRDGAYLSATSPARLDLGQAFTTSHNFAGAVTIAGNSVVMSSGTIYGSGDMNVIGTFGVTSVTFAGTGNINVAPSGNLLIQAPGFTTASLGRNTTNNGTISIIVGSLNLNGATLNNFGTISLGPGSTSGTLSLSGGTFNNLAAGNVMLNRGGIVNGTGSANLITNSGTITVSGVTSFVSIGAPFIDSGTILIQGGTFSVVGTSDGAYIGGPGFLEFSGIQSTSGNVKLATPQVRVQSGSITNSGTITVSGSFNWTGGTIAGTGTTVIAAGGTLNLPNGSQLLTSTLSNFGVINETGVLNIGSTTVISNEASGVWNINTSFPVTASAAAFCNAGTMNFNPTVASNLTLGGPFTNSGTINLNPGATGFITLASASLLTDSGTINVQSGTLQIGTTVFNNGAYLTGAGTINISPISATVNGTLALAGSNVRLNGGSITGAGNIDVTGTFNWVSGQIAGPGSLSVASGATMNLLPTGGTKILSRTLTNAGTIDASAVTLSLGANNVANLATGVINIGSLGIFGGAPTSEFRNLGVINFNPGTKSIAWAQQLTSSGRINISSGSLFFGAGTRTWSGGTIVNHGFVELNNSTLGLNTLNGDLTLSGDGSYSLSSGSMNGAGRIVLNSTMNIGHVVVTNMDVGPEGVLNTGTATFGGPRVTYELNNHGQINVNTAVILDGGALLTNFPDGVLNVSDSPVSFDSSETGAVNLGVLNVAPGVSGQVSISDRWRNAGTINAASGILFFTGLAINEDAGAVLTGPGKMNFEDTTQFLNGTTTFAGSNMHLDSVRITGQGNLILTGTLYGNDPVNGGYFNGEGTFEITPTGRYDAGSQTLSRPLSNLGIIDIGSSHLSLSSGTINNLAGGVVSATGPGTLSTISGAANTVNRFVNAGSLIVSGQTLQIAVPFSNTGTIDVSGGGTLLLSGPVSQVIGPTLMRGTWTVHSNSTLSIPGAAITNNAANVTLDGAGSAFDAINPIANNSGAFTITGGRSFVTGASYTNSGETIVGSSSALTITGDLTNTGTIDVNGILIVNYTGATPLPAIAGQIHIGAITSGLASAQTGLGYAEASDLDIVGVGTFAGQEVDDTSVIVRYTVLGDANLDNVVDTSDFTAMADHFGSTGANWSDGDYNGDGVVNALDFNVLSTDFGASLPASAPTLGTLVPEPAMGAVLLCLFMRRRRRSRMV